MVASLIKHSGTDSCFQECVYLQIQKPVLSFRWTFCLCVSKHKGHWHPHTTVFPFQERCNYPRRQDKVSHFKYGFHLKSNSSQREHDFSIGKGSPLGKNVNRWLRKITHMLHTDLEEAFLRMKWHFPAWATSHQDPYLTHRKQHLYLQPRRTSATLCPLPSQ